MSAPEPAEAWTQPVALRALVVGLVAGILVALEVLRPVHGIDAGARASLETATVAAAVLTSRLLIEIFGRTRQLRELLLAFGVLAISLADFTSWAGPVVAGVRDPASGAPVRLGCELIGALALAAAAFVRPTSMVKPFRRLGKAAGVLGLCAIAAGALLPEIIAVHPTTAAAKVDPSTAAPLLPAAVQLASVILLAVGGLAFVARSWRSERGTELLAGGSLLLAAAGVQFVAVPTVHADWVTPRDGARLVAFGLLLAGVCLRYAKVQRRQAHATVLSERERIARDLHDGLAQDLVCITTQAQRLDCGLGPDDPLMLATRDALAGVRGVIADLIASTATASEEAARLVAHQLEQHVDVEVDMPSQAGSMPPVDNLTRHLRPRELTRASSGARGMPRLARSRPLGARVRRAA